MAFTPTEEAQVRLLLDQQAAILSLAGNEATITSKLGATKVTLSDLAVASSANASDLMLTRQGVTDKSITPLVLANYINGAIGSAYLPKAGGTATGAIDLSAGGTSTTAALYDSSTKIATTAFTQRALGNHSKLTLDTTSRTLTTADLGSFIHASVAGITLTLPAKAGIPEGSTITIKNTSAVGAVTIDPSGADTFYVTGATVGTLVLEIGESAIFTVAGLSWLVTGDTVTRRLPTFARQNGTSGWQRFPSGLMLQWRSISVPGSGSAIATWPTPFTSACHSVIASVQQGAPSATPVGAGVGAVPTTTQGIIYNLSATTYIFNVFAIGV